MFMFYTSIVYYHNGFGLFFISTNHSLEFISNFSIGSMWAILLTSHLLGFVMNFAIGLYLYSLGEVLIGSTFFCFEKLHVFDCLLIASTQIQVYH